MKAVVCVKQVHTLGDEIEFTDDERDVDPDYLERALNEWDVFALEEALRMREAAVESGEESEVVAVTVGDDEAEEGLRRCLAMGADRAVRIEGEGTDALDPLFVARELAAVISREGADVVLCGVQSSDSVQAATGTMLSALLGLPRVAVVTRIEYDGPNRKATVHRELEGGLVDVVEVDVPAVLTVQTGINQPRYATLRAIKEANQKEIEVSEPATAEPGAYRVRKMFLPERGAGAEMLGDDAGTVASRIAEIVKARLS